MIPARMGSKRLTTKNLRELDGQPLIARAILKARDAGVFDEVWVNSEHPAFGELAAAQGVGFHRRPDALASDTATSEEFVAEFLEAHPCDLLVQVHSIAPMIGPERVRGFVEAFRDSDADVMLSVVHEPLECLYEGRPVNFSTSAKQNSQNLRPVERVTWGLTGWRCKTYLEACRQGLCATWHGRIATFPLNRFEGHVIKTEEDLRLAECMLSLKATEETD
jgi:CMP-N-acetylneuraminic acid synthetase